MRNLPYKIKLNKTKVKILLKQKIGQILFMGLNIEWILLTQNKQSKSSGPQFGSPMKMV